MLRLVVLLFFFSLPSLTFSQLRIQAFDNQPVRYFIKKNGKEVEITKEQADKLFPPELTILLMAIQKRNLIIHLK